MNSSIDLTTDVLDDAAGPVEQLVESQYLRRADVFSVEFKAGNLVVITIELSQIPDDEEAPRLNRVGETACAVANLVFQIVAEAITRELEDSFLRLCNGAGNFVRNAPTARR